MGKHKEMSYHPLTYEVQDSEIASILKSQEQRFTTEKRDRVVWFIFEDKKKCEAIVDAYYNRQLPLQAIDLMDAVKQIKKIIIYSKNL
jgi:hypothetical protein